MRFTLAGIVFGIILVRSEVISWFRIQEMFHFDAFHMYGVLGSAVLVGMISTWLIQKLKLKDVHGEEIVIKGKDNELTTSYILGGSIFGLGWGLTGACPGPIYALIGAGYYIYIIPLLSAIIGAYVYGTVRPKLPH